MEQAFCATRRYPMGIAPWVIARAWDAPIRESVFTTMTERASVWLHVSRLTIVVRDTLVRVSRVRTRFVV